MIRKINFVILVLYKIRRKIFVSVKCIIKTVNKKNDDRSVYKVICDNKSYHKYNVIVQKIECSIHLMRAFGKELIDVSEKV